MPKKRYRTPKQRAASRRNLIKARAAKNPSSTKPRPSSHLPMGKNPLMFHNTSPANADKIVKDGFTRSYNGGRYFFRQPAARENWNYYGKAVVGLKIPRKALKVENGKKNSGYGLNVTTFWTYGKNVKGRKVKRYK